MLNSRCSRSYLCRALMAAALILGITLPAFSQASEPARDARNTPQGTAANDRAATLLQEIEQLTGEALAASRAAQSAATVEAVKQQADAVYRIIWGIPSGLATADASGEARVLGWKEQWQVSNAEFDSAYAARYGTQPPTTTDAEALGIVGRGRHVRILLEGNFVTEPATTLDSLSARSIVAPLNNVIGWMKMDDGVTKGERQPRVDLTREWDAPTAFWISTADTGWLFEVNAQALNILKTDYAGDLEMARTHAAAMTELIEKYVAGIDADGDGAVEPVMMEGGLRAALDAARSAGLL